MKIPRHLLDLNWELQHLLLLFWVGVNEVLVVDAQVREAILTKASAAQIQKVAVEKGMTPMLQDGLNKARRGLTSVYELMRTMHE